MKKIRDIKDIEGDRRMLWSLKSFREIEQKHKEGNLFKVCTCGTPFQTNPKRKNGFMQSHCSDCMSLLALDRKLYKDKIRKQQLESLKN